MLIESQELLKRIARMKYDIHESKAYFSQYKAAIDCIDKLEDIIADLEAQTSKNSASYAHAEALRGLHEK